MLFNLKFKETGEYVSDEDMKSIFLSTEEKIFTQTYRGLMDITEQVEIDFFYDNVGERVVERLMGQSIECNHCHRNYPIMREYQLIGLCPECSIKLEEFVIKQKENLHEKEKSESTAAGGPHA